MAKCWRNVRSEHLITASQDTYRGFFFRLKSSIKEHEDTIQSHRSGNHLRSMAIRRSRDLPLRGGEVSSNSRIGLRSILGASLLSKPCQVPHGCPREKNPSV